MFKIISNISYYTKLRLKNVLFIHNNKTRRKYII